MKGLRKNAWKFLLDIVMAVVLVLMYNKRVLGLEFHEIGGLAVCGLFIIHKLLNWPWIKAVTKGLFSRRTPARQKLYWVLDILLFGCFTYILVSGIMISKIVFPSTSGGGSFKMGHYAVAALALALTGIHVGLHMGWIGQRMGFLGKLPRLLRRGLALLLSVAVLVFGGMQLTSTSFVRWLGSLGVVFGASQDVATGFGNQGTFPEIGSTTASGTTATAGTGTSSTTVQTVDSSAQSGTATDNTTLSDANPTAATDGGRSLGGGLMDGQGPHGSGGESSGSTSVGSVLLSFFSILLAFATVTAWTDGGLRALKRKRLLKAAKASAPEA